jgi:hypothetical protein
MTKKKTTSTEDAAKAVFTTNRKKPVEIVVQTNHLTEIIKAHPQYASKPAMQQSVAAIGAVTDVLAKHESDLKAARALITSLVAARGLAMHAYGRARRGLLAVADDIAAGSAATLKEWGFDAVTSHAPLPPSDAPPAGLRVRYTKELVLVIAWKGVAGQRGYAVQIGDGTPQGWGPTIPCTRAHYVPTGLTPGQKIAIRVAVQRKSGFSVWSDALSATVR